MVIVVKTQMYALPNTPYNYKISSNISLLFYKCHCLDLRFQTTPFRGWCRRSQILLTWNSTTWKLCNPNYIICTLSFWEIWYGWVTKQCDLSWPLSVSLAKACFPRLTHTSYWPDIAILLYLLLSYYVVLHSYTTNDIGHPSSVSFSSRYKSWVERQKEDHFSYIIQRDNIIITKNYTTVVWPTRLEELHYWKADFL